MDDIFEEEKSNKPRKKNKKKLFQKVDYLEII